MITSRFLNTILARILGRNAEASYHSHPQKSTVAPPTKSPGGERRHVYVRFSEAACRSQSASRQKEIAEIYAGKHGLDIAEICGASDVSAP